MAAKTLKLEEEVIKSNSPYFDIDTYFDDFKPTFNEERFWELFKNPPTRFKTEQGKKIQLRANFVKSILANIKIIWGEFDMNNVYDGREGSGKSHTVFQHTFVWWYLLTELGMINYPFPDSLKKANGEYIVYYRLKDLLQAFDTYAKIPFMLYQLDESDDLNRKNWNKAIVKELESKLRKERKNRRIVNFILPQLYELNPTVTLSRVNWIIRLDFKIDDDFNILRGDWKLYSMCRDEAVVSKWGSKLSRGEIFNFFNERLNDGKNKFTEFPSRYIIMEGKSNATFVFDKKEYADISRKKNNEAIKEEQDTSNLFDFSKLKDFKKDVTCTWSQLGQLFGMSEDALRMKVKRDSERTKEQ